MDWKKTGKKLLFPPAWLIAVFTLFSAAGLAVVFTKGLEQSAVGYAVYVLSFYTLVVLSLFCALVLPKRIGRIKAKISGNPLLGRYLTDQSFRARSAMYLPVYMNLAYVAIHLLSWYLNRSWWFVVLAAYYLILVLLWALLAGHIRSHPAGSDVPREWRRSRVCAYILLLINLSLSGAVLMILFENKGYDYPGILIYVMAMYTFYSAIHAIVDTVKYRAFESPVMSTAKIVSLSAALVSMLNLETAMFAQFGGEMSVQDQRVFIILTGAGVSITVITLSVILIVKATKQIRGEPNGK